MKKKTLINFAIMLLTAGAIAQAPQNMNYQAVARDVYGNPLPEQNIGIRITITDGNGGPVLYQETHNTTTNQFGLFILDIGNGIPVSGIFSAITWASVTPWLQVEMDPAGGINYADMGSSPLLSVPYSLFAASTYADISGTTDYLVKFTGEQTGINSQVYDNGMSVGINTTAPTGKLNIRGSSNSSQLVIDAFGTQTPGNPLIKFRTGSGTDLMWLHSDNPENTFVGLNAGRVNIATAGGTANTFVGSDAGYSNSTGYDNTVNGNQALYTNTTGHSNTAVGVVALYSNTTGNYNTAIGRGALYFNTSGNFNTGNGSNSLFANTTGNSNTAVGWGSLTSNTTGNYNTANGFASLGSNTTGNNNTASGFQSLFSNTTGSCNTATGYQSLINNTTGSFNSTNGYQALFFNTEGHNNVAVGYRVLDFNSTGDYNTAVGNEALYSNSTGSHNSAVGSQALYSNLTGLANSAFGIGALYSNTSGNSNTAVGFSALGLNTTGYYNTAVSKSALNFNTLGSYNVAVGFQTLFSNSTAGRNIAIGSSALQAQSFSNGGTAWYSDNVAVGYEALFSNQPDLTTNGIENTAVGNYALRSNTTGLANTAIGFEAMYSNSTGISNTACGIGGLYSNTIGNHNTACGINTLHDNTEGILNTAVGAHSLISNTTGDYNSATGYASLGKNETGNSNTACGTFALYEIDTQSGNTAIGSHAGDYYKSDQGTFVGRNAYPNASGYVNVTGLGYDARPTASNQVRIGNSSVTSIGGYTGWTNLSDGRFKQNVREAVPGLEFINLLRPVVYSLDLTDLNADLDKNKPTTLREGEKSREVSAMEIANLAAKEKIVYTGFIAQEVEAAAKSIGFDFSGVDAPKNENDYYGLRYAEFVVPLVKAVQEQQVMIEKLQKEVEELKANK